VTHLNAVVGTLICWHEMGDDGILLFSYRLYTVAVLKLLRLWECDVVLRYGEDGRLLQKAKCTTSGLQTTRKMFFNTVGIKGGGNGMTILSVDMCTTI